MQPVVKRENNMSYKAFSALKEHVEIEMLKTMSYEEINGLLNKQKQRIDELENAGAIAAMNWSKAQHGFECEDLQEFRRVLGQDV